jgi:putative transposase
MLDLKELSESCGQNHVFKIMKNNGITAVRGYKEHKNYGRGLVLRLCHQIT